MTRFPALLYHIFFFNAPSPPQIYTLSLHDALPIFNRGYSYRAAYTLSKGTGNVAGNDATVNTQLLDDLRLEMKDRKSTRLNSSHLGISYAVFCLKKKK